MLRRHVRAPLIASPSWTGETYLEGHIPKAEGWGGKRKRGRAHVCFGWGKEGSQFDQSDQVYERCLERWLKLFAKAAANATGGLRSKAPHDLSAPGQRLSTGQREHAFHEAHREGLHLAPEAHMLLG